MSDTISMSLLEQRRDSLRAWLDDQAPYTVLDQKHLDANTPERAYWHHGYQAALNDIIELLCPGPRTSGSAGTSSSSRSDGSGGPGCPAG
jgi:hypothetical protein